MCHNIATATWVIESQVLNEDIGQQGAQYTAYTQLVVHLNGPGSQDQEDTGSGISTKKMGTVALAGAVVGAIATKLAKL